MHLRKLDQEENFLRKQNFDRIYQQKLAGTILQKKQRSDIIQREQERISEICYVERALLKGFKPVMRQSRYL